MTTKEVYTFDLKQYDWIKFSDHSATTILSITNTPGNLKRIVRLSNKVTLHLSKQQFLEVIVEM